MGVEMDIAGPEGRSPSFLSEASFLVSTTSIRESSEARDSPNSGHGFAESSSVLQGEPFLAIQGRPVC